MRSMIAVAISVSLTAGVFVVRTAAQAQPQAPDAPVWTKTFTDNVQRVYLTSRGSVVAKTKTGIVAVDPVTGKELWTRDDVIQFSYADTTPSAFIESNTGQSVIDLETGKDRWNTSSLGFQKLRASKLLEAQGMLLLRGESPSSSHDLVALKYETGEVLWREGSLYTAPELAGKAQGIRYYTIINEEGALLLDPSYGGLMRLDPATGKLLWRTSDGRLKINSPVSTGGAVMRVSGGRVFVTNGKTVLAINGADGKVVWMQATNFPSPVLQMEPTAAGLLVRGAHNGAEPHLQWRPYLAMLDSATGKALWSTVGQKPDFQGRTAFILRDNVITIAGVDSLMAIDLATGKPVKSAQFAKPLHTNAFCCIEALDNRYFLSARENVRMVDLEGKLYYDKYFKAPGLSLLAKVAMVGAAAAGAALGAGIAGGGLSSNSGILGSMIGQSLAESMGVRFGSASAANRFAYTFTETPDPAGRTGFSLVRIEKATGEEAGRVWFAGRSPDYTLDPVTGIVLVADSKSLFALKFPAAAAR